jgi:hypothetical protein
VFASNNHCSKSRTFLLSIGSQMAVRGRRTLYPPPPLYRVSAFRPRQITNISQRASPVSVSQNHPWQTAPSPRTLLGISCNF